MTKRKLVLEDGTTFIGNAFGGETETVGEVIFYTGMTGYQEVITDPSYATYIVTMTYPSIGAYGMNRDDFEAIVPRIKGMIVKEINDEPSNFRSEETVDQFLKRYDIPGIAGIDTRMLTRTLRERGLQKGIITSLETDVTANHFHPFLHEESVKQVSCTRPYVIPGSGKRVVVIDLGVKQRLLQTLTAYNFHITVVPYNYESKQIRRFKPDGIIVSHGPGNPEHVQEVVKTLKEIVDIPLFSIGLGHQLFAIACGAKTKRIQVGRFGTNFPVKDVNENRTHIATISSHYTVDETTLDETKVEVTYRSLNEGLVEGLRHKQYPALSVQFNIEGAPGSNETAPIIDTFVDIMKKSTVKNGGEIDA